MQDRQSGETRDLTENFDRSVGSFTWSFPRSVGEETQVFFSAEDHGDSRLFEVLLERGAPYELGYAEQVQHADDLAFAVNTIYFTRASITSPNEIWRYNVAPLLGHSEAEPVTHIDDALLSKIDMQPLESFTFKGANNEEVQGFMIKPPGFDPAKKYPLKF